MVKKRPFFIDVDTGTDDAIALACALGRPEIELRAVTAVAGNADLCFTAPNTLNLMRYFGSAVKVAKGAERPLKRVLDEVREKVDTAAGHTNTHGDEGLGDLILPDCGESFYPKDAVDALYEEAVACEGELEVVAVGPLTNIATAIMRYPDITKLIRHITFMGGTTRGGNTTAVAEFNMLCDPEAAHIVLSSGIPITMVGLDVTERANVPDDIVDAIEKIPGKRAEITAKILRFMQERRDKHDGEDTLMHDALALAVAIDPSLVESRYLFVDTECDGKYTFGHTFVAFDNRLGDFMPNCHVALKLDSEAFLSFLIDSLA